MSFLGYGHRQIADEIGVNKNSVGGLLEEQRLKRRAEWKDGDLESIAYYQAIGRKARERRVKYPLDSKAQNVVGLFNVEITARQSIDRILGTHAPTRTENKHNHEHDLIDFSDADDAFLEELERRTAEVGPPEER